MGESLPQPPASPATGSTLSGLEESALLKTLIRHSPAGIAFIDTEFRFRHINWRLAEINGYPPDFHIGKTLAEVVPDLWPKVAPLYRRVLEKGEAILDIELSGEVASSPGQQRDWVFGLYPVQDDGGVLLGIGVMVLEITERMQAERKVEASDRRFRALVENSWDGGMLTDQDGHPLYCSPALTRILGYTPEEFMHRPPEDNIHPADLEIAGPELRRIQTTPGLRTTLAYRVPHKDGSWRSVEVTAANLTDDPSIGAIVLNFHDITSAVERERLEALAAHEHQLAATMMEALPGLVCLWDDQQRFVRWNKALERVTGFGAQEIAKMSPLDFIPAGDWEIASEAILAGFATGHSSMESHLMTKDGKKIPYFFSGVRLITDQGTHLLGIGVDVSQRKRLEQQFRQAQKMEAVGRLAGGVAHDFNNLLTIINGYSELILTRLGRDDPLRELVTEIHKAGENAATLVQQLLMFSRQSVLEPKFIDINKVLAETEKMLGRLIGKDIALTTTFKLDLGPVKADPSQLQQAIINLSVNARDAMPQGGRLTIETREVEWTEEQCQAIADCKPGRYSMLIVADTGTGMDEATKTRIFDPFFTTKEIGKGTGLGLAMVYGFVKSSGGHITVASEPGHGTTFTLYFPQIREQLSSGKSFFSTENPPSGRETILLVEDDDPVRALTCQVLKAGGYTVLEAKDGIEAVHLAENHQGPIHLLVTDLVMPHMGGRQAAERVGALRPGIKVLYCSGYTDDKVVRHGVQEEGTAFMQKPYRPALLAQKVRDLLDDRQ